MIIHDIIPLLHWCKCKSFSWWHRCHKHGCKWEFPRNFPSICHNCNDIDYDLDIKYLVHFTPPSENNKVVVAKSTGIHIKETSLKQNMICIPAFWYTDAKTKFPPSSKQHIQISLKFVPSSWQCTIIGSDNGLLPSRQQGIICTNDGLVYWCICHLTSMS